MPDMRMARAVFLIDAVVGSLVTAGGAMVMQLGGISIPGFVAVVIGLGLLSALCVGMFIALSPVKGPWVRNWSLALALIVMGVATFGATADEAWMVTVGLLLALANGVTALSLLAGGDSRRGRRPGVSGPGRSAYGRTRDRG